MSTTDYLLEAPSSTGRTVEGLLVPYDRWLQVSNSREGSFVERFAAGSLRKSFGLLRKLRGYFEHGRSSAFGPAPIMDIEEGWEEPTGAFFRASLLDGIPSYIVDGIRKGLYGASVGAEPVDVDVERFPQRSSYNPKGLEERTYRSVVVHDISLTSRPAYEDAVVSLRARDFLVDDTPGTIHRVALEPVRFTARRPVRDYLAEMGFPPRRDYLSEDDWRL
jgi:phage head maturation protease